MLYFLCSTCKKRWVALEVKREGFRRIERHESSVILVNQTLLTLQILDLHTKWHSTSSVHLSFPQHNELVGKRQGQKRKKLIFHPACLLLSTANNSAQNISAHHHGGNCNVKPRTVKSQNTRHIQKVLEHEQDNRDTSKKQSLQVLLKQLKISKSFCSFHNMKTISDYSKLN